MTTSTSTAATKNAIKDPGQLLASLPYLLGFRPAESVVMLGHLVPRGTRLGLVLRADLPPDEHARQQAGHLAGRYAGPEFTAVTLVVIAGPGTRTHSPPHRLFVDLLTEALAAVGRPVLHSIWTPEIAGGARWGCYRDEDCGGVQPDGQSTVAAAAITELGHVTFDSREEVEKLLEPRSKATLARRSAMLTALTDPPWGDQDPIEAGSAEVRAALGRVSRGDHQLSDAQAVRLAVALSQTQVRDACLGTAVPAGTSLARDAETLWLTLVRELPAPERAAAACLAGYSAYARGDGALAGMAFENALEADPEYVMAQLLAACLDRALPPAKLAGLSMGSLFGGPGGLGEPQFRPGSPGGSE
ncbi:DUF4192 domain-containing protein [Amycolatopsis sp. H20-H5]|uniref:DUF4192 domain-containing protein n=1 Tax=Amycolatopsis sp. H20-H5 TaxID=3046309 RepID=UPI002DBAA34A|nr:DUF4192 domain-containing protein [Amycolatopsis sp. H20-H5]MEC3973967.1 DUF4192 domain-containing protein [Amycolatopsis sp. H20-H5]